MKERPPRTVRFIRAEVDPPTADGHCRAVVQVEHAPSGLFSGTAHGGVTEADIMRAVARATADAVSEALGKPATIRIRGIQTVEAFGQKVVIVSVAGSRDGKPQLLLGVCEGGDNPARAAALAVLNATNRFLGA